ncbi:MAG: hypothetical protein ACR2NM_05900, partial [Bythopirellula sp.]
MDKWRLPTIRTSSRRGKISWFLVFVWAFVLATFSVDFARAQSADADRSIAKLIPDCKALAGSPTTKIDLSQVFAETSVATNGPLDMSVVHNKKAKVAGATIEDGMLLLEWGKI